MHHIGSSYTSYLTAVTLKRIRGFKELHLPISASSGQPRMRTVIIGRNGTCKTTLLRAIVLGLCNEAEANALLAMSGGRYVTQNAESGRIELGCDDGLTEVTITSGPGGANAGGNGNGNGPNPAGAKGGKPRRPYEVAKQPVPTVPHPVFVCGYGVGRSRAGGEEGEQRGIIGTTATLFDEGAALANPELTLRRLRDFLAEAMYEPAMQGIKRALGLSESDTISLPRGGGVTVSGTCIGRDVPLAALADGYRMTFNWIMDLYGHAIREGALDEEGAIHGILLIDELEQHMHPSMQVDALPRLSALFPRLQIIATTHSPLIALACDPSELVVLKRRRKYVYSGSVPDFSGYSAEDVLTDSRLFDTAAYGQELEKKLREYRKLAQIAQGRRTEVQQGRIQMLALELRDEGLLSLPEEDPLLQALNDIRRKYDI